MKRAEAANAALNRLVAGDFLESLGKELGLKVPEPARPAVDRSAPKETDGGGSGRGKDNVEQKGMPHGPSLNFIFVALVILYKAQGLLHL